MAFDNIKSFSVHKLFGTTDVNIPFENNIKILIGENGLGKTQVLNIFYYTLTKNFSKLSEYNFESLRITFKDDTFMSLSKSDIEDMYEKAYKHPLIREIIETVGLNQFESFRNTLMHGGSLSRSRLEEHPVIKKMSKNFPPDYIIHSIEQSIFESRNRNKRGSKNTQLSPHLEECDRRISKNVNKIEILYFPTFRRVEEDLANLGYNDEQVDKLSYDKLNREDSQLIHFGMDDVNRRFRNIENSIDRLLKEGFSEMSSEILSQLIEDDEESSNEEFLSDIGENDVEILLARVGNRISNPKKDKIKEIVLSKKAQPKDSSLNFFLKKLIEIYSLQKELDNSVKIFRDLCNKYLINKNVFYDESAIKIYIKSKASGAEIALSKLSSGEKQIISMFSKIYLSDIEKRFIVLFDEPELSLSMTWQKQLLPDILNSNKCEFLLAVTHSPFIFDNELDRYAIGLNEYITPSKLAIAK
ncbi:AAA family ATPase [Hymenobacter profundi]|uniref:ATP-binding protein n=1 Tax=Hymenobacter profundi TaxID=1982110 RepID=A0ABS6X597_9BACT|nr:AAA family ATPase [Hymenobacter profundi]MBW3130900.1 ATP-binding protein [Hymenobacter profundi]